MSEFDFPTPKALFDKHFPDERFAIRARYRQLDGHDCSQENFVGGIPPHTEYLNITCTKNWSSDVWNMLQEAYEDEGYETHLKVTSGTTRTRSGRCRHAPTQLWVWE